MAVTLFVGMILAATPASGGSATDLSMDQALLLASAAIEDCRGRGQAVAASVVDDQGVPIIVLRGDGLKKAPAAASRKASTAVAFGQSGAQMEQRVKEDPAFAALIAARRDIYNPDGGSIPLMSGGRLIGGLAVAYTGHEVAHACILGALARHPLETPLR